jgi:molybdenum-dependent DNA-binding transcriptional regulator ModE
MRVFVKIADAGNLSAAGRQLGLSLTSVSRQLMALEGVLGTTLVERTTRHLSLTESGLLYYERAKQILEEVDEAERGLTAQRAVASGRYVSPRKVSMSRFALERWNPQVSLSESSTTYSLLSAPRPTICACTASRRGRTTFSSRTAWPSAMCQAWRNGAFKTTRPANS